MTKIAHFEITSPDPKSTAQFYKAVFGWSVTRIRILAELLLVGSDR